MKSARNAVGIAVLELWLPLALLATWWIVSEQHNSVYFPPLSEIVTRFRELWIFDGVTTHILPSLRNWAVGVAGAIVLGIALGIVSGLVPLIRDILHPGTEFFRAIPGLALIPLALMLFGLGPKMAIPLVMYGAFWPIFLNTVDGIRGMEPIIRDTCRVFRTRPTTFLFRVAIPAASPQIVVGVRQALSIGIAVIFFSEMIGATEGIGYVTRYAERSFETAGMWAGILLLGILGYLVNLAFHFLEYRLLSWHSSSQKQMG